MPNINNLQLSDIKRVINASSLKKAKGYRRRVKNQSRRGNMLTADVIGTQRYHVKIEINPNNIDAYCTCPYDWGGYCKHIGAVLLLWMENPQSFVDKEDDPPHPATAGTRTSALETIPVPPPKVYSHRKLPWWIIGTHANRRAEDAEFLAQSMERWLMQDLRAMASKRGWRIKGARKANFIEQLILKLIDPTEIEIAYQALSAEHRQVLHALTFTGGLSWLEKKDFVRLVSVWGKLKQYKKIDSYIIHLEELGLTGFDEGSTIIEQHIPPLTLPSKPILKPKNQHLCNPYELVNRTIQLIILFEKQSIQLRPPMPRPYLEKTLPLLCGWDYIPEEVLALKGKRPHQISPTKTMTVPPPQYALPDESIARLTPVAGGEAQLDFIYHLLVQAHIIHPGSPVTLWGKTKDKFLRLSVNEQRALLARLYFYLFNWNELWELLRQNKNLQLKRSWLSYRVEPFSLKSDLQNFREMVLRGLANFPDNTWIAIDTINQLFKQVWYTFDGESLTKFYRGDRPNWALYLNGKPLNSKKNSKDWAQAQGAFIQHILTAPLHWLGMTDLQFDDKSQLQAVRFLGLRDIFWDRIDAPSAPHRAQFSQSDVAASIVIDGTHIAIPLTAMNAQINALLDKLAQLDDVTLEQFNYRLSTEITWKSFEAGETLDSLLKMWQENMPIEMPDSIRQVLDKWWQGYGKVRIYQDMTIIEFSDDHSLSEMKAVTTLDNYLIAEISPRLVVIKKEAVEKLIAQLEKAGYTPKLITQVTA